MQNKTTLLFDFDGTIADSLYRLLEISNTLAEEYGFSKLDKEDIARFRSKSTLEAFKELKVPLLKIPIIASRVKREFQKEVHLIKPFAQMEKVLPLLGQLFRLGILTSNTPSNVECFLKTNQLPFFDFIYSSSNIFGKSRVLRKIMREKQFRPEELVYIGDEMRDIEAAKNLGIDMVAVSWGAHTAKALASLKPSYLIHQPDELLTLFAD
ncbi:phosphoglycolate phosphatase [Catalinimonas alkaloidigena]|uniref:HAD-IA family hydrolase n=1 Tax=Catalinimonas alkaloidigena TaxID=1075417 RepID=UPI002404B680|nr:HAD-IA family hydrolase [Catalinimonas alkaloidigena]MDF9795984.1 phosphoglycolate phosphatase [Catalinimonas alkaloidigena]